MHISKIRSLHLDHLDNETLMLILNVGNNVVNEIYEKMVPKCIDPDSPNNQCPFVQKATPKCDK